MQRCHSIVRINPFIGEGRRVLHTVGVHNFSLSELRILARLKSPAHIQDFLNDLAMNKEEHGDTCLSPRRVLTERHAHCIEGAMLAAVALRLHGHPPLLLDLTATKHDFDHVVAPFRLRGYWGAISKTNHAVLRYREPIYRTIRELVLSYFHEYFLDDGRKTLRSYSRPVNLSRFDKNHWMTSEGDVWFVPEYLCDVPHIPLLSPAQVKGLRRADAIERKAGALTEW